jgi:acyl carrier protein
LKNKTKLKKKSVKLIKQNNIYKKTGAAMRNIIIETLSKITRIDADLIGENILVRKELGIDSLMSLEIVAQVERLFKIKLNEYSLVKIITVGDFVNLVEASIKKGAR